MQLCTRPHDSPFHALTGELPQLVRGCPPKMRVPADSVAAETPTPAQTGLTHAPVNWKPVGLEHGGGPRNGSGRIERCQAAIRKREVSERAKEGRRRGTAGNMRGASNQLIGIGRHCVPAVSSAEAKDPSGIHWPSISVSPLVYTAFPCNLVLGGTFNTLNHIAVHSSGAITRPPRSNDVVMKQSLQWLHEFKASEANWNRSSSVRWNPAVYVGIHWMQTRMSPVIPGGDWRKLSIAVAHNAQHCPSASANGRRIEIACAHGAVGWAPASDSAAWNTRQAGCHGVESTLGERDLSGRGRRERWRSAAPLSGQSASRTRPPVQACWMWTSCHTDGRRAGQKEGRIRKKKKLGTYPYVVVVDFVTL
ncbi:hypothetical protein B0H13DRAFT_1851521 [Mycena leptocephala]|nr:hypothetical protein B0H13DRAFT_1851521 [Mycena leptocephala]